MYVKQNAGILTNEGSVDIVQKYSQILKSVIFNQTMMVMIATCAVGIIIVYLIRRLSMDYSWIIAIIAGSVAELLVIFIGDFVFGVSVAVGAADSGHTIVNPDCSGVQFFYHHSGLVPGRNMSSLKMTIIIIMVKAVPKMNVSTPM